MVASCYIRAAFATSHPAQRSVKTQYVLEFAFLPRTSPLGAVWAAGLLPFASSHIALSLERSGPPAQLMNIRVPSGAKHAVFCFNIDRGSTEHPFRVILDSGGDIGQRGSRKDRQDSKPCGAVGQTQSGRVASREPGLGRFSLWLAAHETSPLRLVGPVWEYGRAKSTTR